jgi:hypothetical protein
MKQDRRMVFPGSPIEVGSLSFDQQRLVVSCLGNMEFKGLLDPGYQRTKELAGDVTV